MSVVTALIVRDVRRAWSHGGASLPLAFFLLVAILFPFAIGPDRVLLAPVGGGAIWAAALLAALLPVQPLVAHSPASGVTRHGVGQGQRVSVGVDTGGRRRLKKKNPVMR